ncbi:FAD-linked oxidoreductase-like protein [Pelagophyceae sp. CCMP2097]|nr:FAD-linked oxidoreductase-like protein [Pelagophyceae sp. CCMP2097]
MAPQLLELLEARGHVVDERTDERREKRTVFVNWLGHDAAHAEFVCAAVKLLHSRGLDAVPHVPASSLKTAQIAKAVLSALQDAGAMTVLCLGGNQPVADAGGAVGDVCTASDVAAVCVRLGLKVAFAGFPEGHPSKLDGVELLKNKIAALLPGIDAAGAHATKTAIVTQFSFNPAAVSNFLDAAPSSGAVFVGVAGPALPGVLAKFAQLCHVGPSKLLADAANDDATNAAEKSEAAAWRFSAGGPGAVRPTAAVLELAAYVVRRTATPAESDGGIRLHMYPFGGVDATLALLEDLATGKWPTDAEIAEEPLCN